MATTAARSRACRPLRRSWSPGRGQRPTVLLAEFTTVWSELFPAEQARIVQLLVERVDIQDDALEVRVRADGLASLLGELRQQGERKAA
jgi:hypothetical protein